MRSKYYR